MVKDSFMRKGLLILFILLLASFASGASYVQFLADGFFQGDLEVTGTVSASEYCIGESCIQSWSSGGGSSNLPTNCANGQIAIYNTTSSTWYCGDDKSSSVNDNPGGTVDQDNGKWICTETSAIGLTNPVGDRSIFFANHDGYLGNKSWPQGRILFTHDSTITCDGNSNGRPKWIFKSDVNGWHYLPGGLSLELNGTYYDYESKTSTLVDEIYSLNGNGVWVFIGESTEKTTFITATQMRVINDPIYPRQVVTKGYLDVRLPTCSTNKIMKFNVSGTGKWDCVAPSTELFYCDCVDYQRSRTVPSSLANALNICGGNDLGSCSSVGHTYP